jgi:hypothetical protein
LVRYGTASSPGIDGSDGDDPVASHHGVTVLEARGRRDHPHAEAGEAFLGIVRGDRRDHVLHVPADLGEIDADRSRR